MQDLELGEAVDVPLVSTILTLSMDIMVISVQIVSLC